MLKTQQQDPTFYAQRCEALDETADALDEFKLAAARLACASSNAVLAGNPIRRYPEYLPSLNRLAADVQAMHVGLTDL